ncbi:MAG: cupin domain-containing protein [Planctomycetota bacterium]
MPNPDDNAAPTATFVDLSTIEPVNCPCGWARRAFAGNPNFPGTVHLTEITDDAVSHYHREHTELYVILDCPDAAALEIEGQRHPVKPLNAILIPPGVSHRAVGRMRVLIVCVPDFDPADEHPSK